MYPRTRKDVTLIEMFVVVLILAALSTIAIPRISQSATKAKSKACQTNIDIINSTLELYNADNGSYPTSLSTITESIDYFPDGAPACPIDGSNYTMDPTTHRVDTTDHLHEE